MKFYFSPIDGDSFDITNSFVSPKGKTYEMAVEFGTNMAGTDDFVILDSIGRSVPLPANVETLEQLIDILYSIRDYKVAEKTMESMEAVAESDIIVEPNPV